MTSTDEAGGGVCLGYTPNSHLSLPVNHVKIGPFT